MKKLLLRCHPLTLLLFAALLLGAPATKLMAKPAGDFYQQPTPLKPVLDQVGKHFNVTFLFEEELIKNKTTAYRFNPAGATLDKTLQDLLGPLGLKPVKVDGSNYAVVSSTPRLDTPANEVPAKEVVPEPATSKPEEKPVAKESITNNSAAIFVRGRVVSESKEEPIPGANISVKNTGIGTTSDADGYFTLRMPAGARVIEIDHVSFTAREAVVTNSNMQIFRMAPKVKEMTEVVVVNQGMFKKNKETFTGSSTVVTGDQVRAVNMVNALDALKVFDPAVRIPDNVQFGSDPNRLPIITLRGTNNFPQQTTGTQVPTSGADFMANYANNPNQPLFILDGFEVSMQKIYDLDVNRIENFTILKDAAATSIYGSRAANGVIVVDTKQPSPGKLRVSYSGMGQVTAPDLTVYDLTNAAEKLEVERLAGLYSTYSTGIRPDADAILRENYSNRKAAVERGVNTYWLSQPLRTGFGQRHSVYMEGGDNFIRYGIDLGYNNTAGVMKNSNRRVYSGGMNFSYRFKGFLFKNVLSIADNKSVNSNYGSFGDYSRQNPFWAPYDSNGNIQRILEVVKNPLSGFTNYLNPLYNTTLNTINESQYTSIINQTNLDWLIGRGWRLGGRFQFTKQNDLSNYFLPAQHTSFDSQTDFTKKGSYTKGNGNFFSYDGSLQVEYNKRVGLHQFNNATGASIQQTKSEFLSVYVEGFPNDRLSEISFGNGYPPNSKPSYRKDISRLLSAYSNFGYSYDTRYNAEFSLRSDGSSQFGANKRFGTFWSAGASWNMHKENFFSKSTSVNLMRLRASVGTTGDNKFQPYMGISTYNYYTDQNYRGQIGTTLAGYGNEDLQWQQTFKRNIGIDLGFFKNRITASVDVYRENTTNLILDMTTPPSVGFNSFKQNVGELENNGWEFKLRGFIIRNEKKSTYWSVYVNGLHNTDKIKKISNSLSKLNETNDKGNQTLPLFRFQEGQSVNSIWAVKSLGIDPSTGRELYMKKDGTITYNWDAADKVVVGNTVSDLRGSFGTNFSWKGFSVGLYFSYEFGGQLYNQTLIDRVEVTNYTYNVDRRVLLGRWKQPGNITYYKGLVDENGRTVTTVTNATSRFVQDERFINAESISISYAFPESFNKKVGLHNTRVSFTTNDIKRWSTIEVERGLQYPFARNFTFNLSTTF
jgi:TonB-linked SusC/RagA family outer membrane protein